MTARLEMKGIRKTFAGVAALDGVDLALAAGSVHAIAGENGAGKSTLIKVMTGALRPTRGRIALRGATVELRSPQEAQSHGIVAVYQEVEVLAHRTVAENLLLGREPRRYGLIDWRAMDEQARELLAELGLRLEPRTPLGELPIALRQMVGIARGAALAENVLVLDEPTSSLPAKEIDLLFELVRRLKERGRAIVYISHRLDEVYALCDTVTVLRDGKRVATSKLADVDRVTLVTQMLGAPLAGETSRAARELGDVVLRARDLRREPALRSVSFAVRAGEIVGLGGLLGSGRTETLRAIFGADRAAGAVEVDGTAIAHHPRDAIAAGVGFVPEERAADGIVPELSVRENLILAALPHIARLGFVSRRRERALVDDLVRRLRVKASSVEQPIRELSGGNQQKVLLARWLARAPKVLLVDEPTRGIDIGARAEIHALLATLAAAGLAIVVVSSEIDELAATCMRVVVLRDGTSVAELTEVDGAALVRAIAGAA